MKSFKLIPLILVYSSSALFAQDADVKIKLSSTGAHSGKCILLQLENTGTSSKDFGLSAGTYLQQFDSTSQDHTLTENVFVKLPPKQKKQIALNALCCQRNKSCPSAGSLFQIKPNPNKLAVTFCSEIALSAEQDYCDQEALWTLLHNEDGNQITGADSLKVMKYRNFICKLSKTKVEPYHRESYYKPATRVQTSLLDLASEGYAVLRDMKVNDVVIAGFYDDKGNLVSDKLRTVVDVVTDGPIIKGKYKYSYKASVENLDASHKYFFRILVNGVVRKEYLYTMDV
jgi:hypothetical protein